MTVLATYYWMFEVVYLVAVVVGLAHFQLFYLLPSGKGIAFVWVTTVFGARVGGVVAGHLTTSSGCKKAGEYAGSLGTLLLHNYFRNRWIIPDLSGVQVLVLTFLIGSASILCDIALEFILQAANLKRGKNSNPTCILDHLVAFALSAPPVFYYLRVFQL
jgi:hypothetical protein